MRSGQDLKVDLNKEDIRRILKLSGLSVEEDDELDRILTPLTLALGDMLLLLSEKIPKEVEPISFMKEITKGKAKL